MKTQQVVEIWVDQEYTQIALVPDQLNLEVEISVIPASSIAYLEALRTETEGYRDDSRVAANDSQASYEQSDDRATESDISAAESLVSATQSANHAESSRLSMVASQDSAGEAQASEQGVKQSATEAENSAAEALVSQQFAAGSEQLSGQASAAAQLAEQNAKTAQGLSETAQGLAEEAQGLSETAQQKSETAQLASEVAQGKSETAQGASETARDTSIQKATESNTSAVASEVSNLESQSAQVKSEQAQARSESAESGSESAKAEAITAKTAAELAELNAKSSETAAGSSASAASSSKTAAAGSASASESSSVASEVAKAKAKKWADDPYNSPVETGKYSSRHWSEQARQYTETMTNGMYFAGSWDMSDGLPPDPVDHRAPWYRIVSNLNVQSIAYSTATPGDQLCWDPMNLEWFIIDTTDQVTLVNGQIGVVVLDSEDVGARSDSWVPSWAQVSSKPSSFPPSSHNHDDRYYTESESNGRFLGKTAKAADANQLDGIDSSQFLRSNANAVSASKLETARTIALSGEVTGSASFDGSSNVSIDASLTEGYIPPIPDFHMPLSSGIHIHEGVGTSMFARAGKATYINRQEKLVEAAVDEPRFEKQGILIEGKSTNVQEYSTTIATDWGMRGGETGTVELTPDMLGLDGLPSCKVTCLTTSYTYLTKTPSSSWAGDSGKTVTGSCFVKRGDSDTCQLTLLIGSPNGIVVFNVKEGTVDQELNGATGSIEYIADGWYRATITRILEDTSENPAENVRVQMHPTINGLGYTYFQHPQLEELPFASSYIPTDESTVTRAADVVEVQYSGNATLFDRTISAQVFLLGEYKVDANARRHIYSHSGSHPSNYMNGYLYDSIDGRYKRIAAIEGNSGSDCFLNIQETEGLAVFRKQGESFDLFWNGEQGNTFSRTTPLPFENFFIGSQYGNARYLWGHIKDFRIWHHALTDTQIKALGGY